MPRLSTTVGVLCVPVLGAIALAQADTARKDSTATTVVSPAPVLPTVKVSGRLVQVPPRFQDAYKRAASGRGYYFTREEVDASNPRDLQTLLQRVPAVLINDRGITFQKCQGGLPSPGNGGEQAAQPAKVQIYIDGRRTSASDGEDALEVIAEIPPSAIQLMEVYNGASRIPGEYSNDACAVILIWTKSY